MENKVYSLHPRQMYLPLAISLLLSVCSAYSFGMWLKNMSLWPNLIVGIAGILFFGRLSLKGFKQVKEKPAILTLGETGFTDLSLYKTPYTVQYSYMDQIKYYVYKKKKFVGINLTPEGEESFFETLSHEMRDAMQGNKKISGYLVNIPLDYINVSSDDLCKELNARKIEREEED